MTYIKVQWTHELRDEPSVIFSEVIDRRENRKIELYSDGRMGFASPNQSTRGAFLAVGHFPEISEIAAQTEFTVEVISQDAFESEWLRATGTG